MYIIYSPLRISESKNAWSVVLTSRIISRRRGEDAKMVGTAVTRQLFPSTTTINVVTLYCLKCSSGFFRYKFLFSFLPALNLSPGTNHGIQVETIDEEEDMKNMPTSHFHSLVSTILAPSSTFLSTRQLHENSQELCVLHPLLSEVSTP